MGSSVPKVALLLGPALLVFLVGFFILPKPNDLAYFRPDFDGHNPATMGWVRPPVIYGHVHMAKTAGTTLNGLLASRYERVCGHKGYSYNYNEYNWRINNDELEKKRLGMGKTHFNRMIEIGFHDCDLVSLERNFSEWSRVVQIAEQAKVDVELHVPCRDPLQHLMSQCNYRDHVFNCSSSSIEEQFEICFVEMYRFQNLSLSTARSNVELKCFDSEDPMQYVNFMDNFLQPKRLQAETAFRASNKDRMKESECIWKMSNDYQQELTERLLAAHAYYQFCDVCMGSEDELPLT